MRNGGDVTAHDLLHDRGLPERGTVGMHVLRVYERLARPPYADRARELLERYGSIVDELQARGTNHAEAVEAALDQFTETGQLPHSTLLANGVLAAIELEGLVHHARGADVDDLMFLLDVVDEGGALCDKALKAIWCVLQRGYRRRQS